MRFAAGWWHRVDHGSIHCSTLYATTEAGVPSPDISDLKTKRALQKKNGKNTEAEEDYLLLTGDPALIGVACSLVSDTTNGKYNLLKWDKQERKYYPIEINLYEKGEIDDN